MGNRVSIQFAENANPESGRSVTLFSHWGGRDFVELARLYMDVLISEQKSAEGSKCSTPLDRREPSACMTDFLRWLFAEVAAGKSPYSHGERITGNYYLGATQADGDNSDAGHFLISCDSEAYEWNIAKATQPLKPEGVE